MVAAGVIVAVVLGASSPWQGDGVEPDGLTLESREVPESSFPELRITAHASASPLALSEAAWELRRQGMQMLYLEARSVLRESPVERTVYMRIHPPMMGARECVLKQMRAFDPQSGSSSVWYRAMSLRAMANYAPIAQLRGEWHFDPDPKGGTRVVFTTLIDIGGVPAWLAKGPQRGAALATVREVIARAGDL